MTDAPRLYRVGDVVRLKDREGDWTIRGREAKPNMPVKYRLEREGVQAVAYQGDIWEGGINPVDALEHIVRASGMEPEPESFAAARKAVEGKP